MANTWLLVHSSSLSCVCPLGLLLSLPPLPLLPLGQRPNPHTHTGLTINRPASSSSSSSCCARSAQPRNQLTGNFNYFTGCVRHAKWPEPNVNTIRQCHTGQACSAHEIINSSRRGGGNRVQWVQYVAQVDCGKWKWSWRQLRLVTPIGIGKGKRIEIEFAGLRPGNWEAAAPARGIF